MGKIDLNHESRILALLKENRLDKKGIMPLPDKNTLVAKGVPEALYPYFKQLHGMIKEPTFRGLGNYRLFNRDLPENLPLRMLLYKSFLNSYAEAWSECLSDQEEDVGVILNRWKDLIQENRQYDFRYPDRIIPIMQEAANYWQELDSRLDFPEDVAYRLSLDYYNVSELWLGKIKDFLQYDDLKACLDAQIQKKEDSKRVSNPHLIQEMSCREMSEFAMKQGKFLKSGQKVSQIMQSALKSIRKTTDTPILDTSSDYLFVQSHQDEAGMRETLGIDDVCWSNTLRAQKSRRQYTLNQVSQILHEIAWVLDIPRQAVGLGKHWDGEQQGITLAFGIFNTRNKQGFDAFYRADSHSLHFKNADNNWKALVHEWFHALDYTLGKKLSTHLINEGFADLSEHRSYSRIYEYCRENLADNQALTDALRDFNPHLDKMMSVLMQGESAEKSDFIQTYRNRRFTNDMADMASGFSYLLLMEFSQHLNILDWRNIPLIRETVDDRVWQSGKSYGEDVHRDILEFQRKSLLFLSDNNWGNLTSWLEKRIQDEIERVARPLAKNMANYIQGHPNGVDFQRFRKLFLIAPDNETECRSMRDEDFPLSYPLQDFLNERVRNFLYFHPAGNRQVFVRVWAYLEEELNKRPIPLSFKDGSVNGVWERSKLLDEYFRKPEEIFARLGESLWFYHQNHAETAQILEKAEYLQPYENQEVLEHFKKGIQYFAPQGFDLNPEDFRKTPLKAQKNAREEDLSCGRQFTLF